ncbi:TetR/AcrR family transcriptional regulator C-terminal domain-containing protein [Streptomyces misionensis]|uniref:TetR/AcrR family transcriptional regulator C-terminal domain-containing protein n=1 Tax=Streptomyces misionensis TaxID=67331 RepID=UPI0033FCEAD7
MAAADARGHGHAHGDIVEGRLAVLTAEVGHGLGPRRRPTAHVSAPPTLANALRLLDRIGTLVARTGLPADRHFAVSTAISYYITGVSAQIIAPRTTHDTTVGRDVFLARTAQRWEELDPADYPFLTRTTQHLRDHADRDQFITGLDMLLGGLNATEDSRPPA